MFKKTIYECEYCRSQHKTIEQVEACEVKCLHFQKEKEIEKILKKYHENDTRYVYHCVDCGIKLVEHENCFDGIDIDCGRVIFETERAKAFGGLRCIDCHGRLRDILLKALMEKENK